jgi:phage shock protein A
MAKGFWQTAWTMIVGTANDALDKAVDPAVVMRQGIRELENQISSFQHSLTDVIAQKNMVKAQFKQQQEDANEWKELASVAKAKGDMESARNAASRSIDSQATADSLASTLETIEKNIVQLKQQLEQLKNKKDQAEIEVKSIEARTKAADASIAVRSIDIGGTDMGDMIDLARKKASEKEAKAQAMSEVADTGKDLKTQILSGGNSSSSQKVDDFLAKL